MQDTQLFEITDYNLWEDDIEVFTDKKDYFIIRQKFENWLRFSDRLNYEMNYSDHNGEHIQETWVMSLEEYWGLTRKEIIKDLYDYIVVKIIGEETFDIFKVLNKIIDSSKLFA